MSVATVNVAAPSSGLPVRGGKNRKTNHPDRNNYVDRTDQAFEIFWNNAKCTLSNGKLCEEFDQCKRSNFLKRCESDTRALKILDRFRVFAQRYNHDFIVPNQYNSLDEIEGLELPWYLEGDLLLKLSPYLRKFSNLKTLEIMGENSGNISLSSLPAELGDLSNLETLKILHMYSLTSLPAELGKLSKLKTLELGNNLEIRSLPVELGNLKNLETLKIYYNKSLESLPNQLGNLSNLKTLEIWNNDRLRSLPDGLDNLPNLKTKRIVLEE